jgi:hypothetical protein
MKGLPSKRKEALAKGSSWYYTGKPCVNGHVTKRLASNGYCYECSRCHASKWKADNPARLQEYERRVWQDNKEKGRERYRDWAKKNRAKLAAKAGLRRALQDRATPAWVDKLALEKIYEDCQALTKATGVLYHVDHIVPLKNFLVCGLHVPWNLQLLTASENSRKRNLFNPELPRVT